MADNTKTTGHWSWIATKIMFQLIEHQNEFTADEFYVLSRNESIPPDLIKRFAGSFFRSFQSAGYIHKTERFRLSERNRSTPLPIWKPVIIKNKTTEPQEG